MAIKRPFSSGLQARARSEAVVQSRAVTPAPITSSSGPGGGGGSPTGPAGGILAGTYPDPISNVSAAVVWSTIQATRFTFPVEAGYPGSGTANLNMTAQNNIVITLSGTLTIVDAARSSGMVNFITLTNPTGGDIAVTLPGWTVTRDALPTSVPAGASYDIIVRHAGSTIASGYAHYNAPPVVSGGTVTSVTTAGRGILASPNPIVAAGTITGTDPDHFNVCDYGADATGASDSYAAIAATIAAGVATAKPFTLYFPDGYFKSSHATPIACANAGQAVAVVGNGIGVSQLVYTDTAGDAGMVITRQPSGGTYLTNGAVTIRDLTYVSSGNSNATAIKITVASNDGGNNGHKIMRVGFDSIADDTAHYWAIAIDLFNNNSTVISDCFFLRNAIGIQIKGNTGTCAGFKVRDSWFQGGTYGIKINGTGGPANRIEGVQVINCTCFLVDYCVWWENTNAGSVLQMIGGDFGGLVEAIHVLNVFAITLNGIGVSASATGAKAIKIVGGEGCAVTGCFIGGAGDGTSTGVYINTYTGGTVIGNMFYNFQSGDVCIKFDTGSAKCIGTLNTQGVVAAGTYTNSGTGNVMTGNL